MAVRTPLKLVSGELVPMTTADITNIKQQAIHVYALNPSVTLSVVSSNGNLNAITDTRYQAGASSAARPSPWPGSSNAPDVVQVDVSYDRFNQTVSSTANSWTGPNKAYPLFYNSGELQAMSKADFYDTFIYPTIDDWHAPSGSGNFAGAGTYYIKNTTTVSSGDSLVSNTPVFVDTIADVDSYLAGTAGALTRDAPETVTSYYLHRTGSSSYSYTAPIQINSDNDLQVYTTANFNSLLEYHMRYAIANSASGHEIRYQVGEAALAGQQMGTGMINSDTAGNFRKLTGFQEPDDYFIQDVPDGTAVTRNTYYLKMQKNP